MTFRQHTASVEDYHLRLLGAVIAVALSHRRQPISGKITRSPLPPTKQASEPSKPHKRRKTALGTLLKQADKAGKHVTGAEVYPDRTVLQFGDLNHAASENPWLTEIEKATRQ